jgi:rhamnosyltransferase
LATTGTQLTNVDALRQGHAPAAKSGARTAGVIVLFQPDLNMLGGVVSSAAAQVSDLILIANDGAPWSRPLPENAVFVRQEKNLGLGAAYNLAARWASERGATHLLLLDQDSVAAPGMVALLLEGFEQPGPVAATGPLWRDSRTGDDGFFVRAGGRWGMRRSTPRAGEIVAVDFLISSGSLISLGAFADVGPFDETLFIEHVDADWVLRALAKGYRLYGVADARLDHALGEAALSLSALGLRRRVFLYAPERNYFLLRNSLILWRRRYVPWRWFFRDARRTLALMLFHLICVPPRLERLRAMFRALRDGIDMT